jgi:hypothetical protein
VASPLRLKVNHFYMSNDGRIVKIIRRSSAHNCFLGEYAMVAPASNITQSWFNENGIPLDSSPMELVEEIASDAIPSPI